MSVKSNSQNSMTDSLTSIKKQPLKESQLFDRLNQPLSMDLIKHFSNPGSLSTVGTKTNVFKVKKYESIETKSTDSQYLLNDQQKFINCYKSDLVFRKRVEIVIKQHQKRMRQKQGTFLVSQPSKNMTANTWKTQKQKQDLKLIELYQKCKKWIVKANEQ